MTRIAFLGPPGTFTEEALLSQPDLADADLVPLRSFPDVLAATEAGEVDLGFVALENSIEGTVRLVLDSLVFDRRLLIQRATPSSTGQARSGGSGSSAPIACIDRNATSRCTDQPQASARPAASNAIMM